MLRVLAELNWICQTCYIIFSSFAKQNQAKVREKFWSSLIDLKSPIRSRVNALGPLCLWRCLIINMKHDYDYDETYSSVQCPLSFLLCLLLSAQYLHHEASGPLIHCIYISIFVWSLSFFFSCIFLQGKGSEKNWKWNFPLSVGPPRPQVLEIDQREQRAQRTKDIWEDQKAGGPKNLIAKES